MEFIAAQAFLDEKHEGPEALAHNNNNIYALGRIGKHNVVMAALPKSSYGTISAAVVARDMVHSFPNIRIGLMVGVGGGAPSRKHDIRLGDVVVGCPSGNIQYEYGKTIQNQAFVEIGHLNQPPQSLLTAVGGLEAEYGLDGHRINEDIENVLNRRPRLHKTHSLPISRADRLYKSDFTHPPTSSTDCSETCSTAHLVPRHELIDDEDNPAIHYGMIACSNHFMKDATKRDKLSSEINVLCFEMEAAGLMKHFPCLVIRGICENADTHKKKAWQRFAAMTAAAYAKDLLFQLVPSRIELETRRAKQIEGIRKWLDPPDTSVNINNARSLRHKGTCRWIFQLQALQEWNSGSRQHLWLHGLASCGKTILSTTLLDFLLSEGDRVVLQDKADGMFRWEGCQLDALEGCLNLEEIEEALKSLPRDLNEMYCRVLESIPKPRKDKTILFLQFLLYSEEPLTLTQAVDLLAIRQQGFNPIYRMPDPTGIPLYCPSLVSVIEVDLGPHGQNHQVIQLAHFSVKEFLLGCHWEEFRLINASISMTHKLLVYLMRSPKIPFNRPSSDDLYPQAAQWTTYAQLAESVENIAQEAAEFFQNDKYLQRWVDTSRLFEEGGETDNYMTSSLAIQDLRRTALSCACGLGLRETTKVLISRGVDLEIPVECNIAISACALSGLFDIAQLLLDRGVDINAVTEGCNPLQVAAVIDKQTRFGSALLAATHRRHTSVVRLLLEKGADYEVADNLQQSNSMAFENTRFKYMNRPKNGEDPLTVASKLGHIEIAQLLQKYRKPCNRPGTSWSRALATAIIRDHYHIIEMFVEAGADINAPVEEYGSLLNLALEKRRLKLIMNPERSKTPGVRAPRSEPFQLPSFQNSPKVRQIVS
ncbi:uncharacterized protein BDZ83DRAFT_724440 [Colletotrichum acutatum]|uniref:Nephrocystin 3-like N-terminal domain-containing protein n=1 Tax=Glomerella acutata TaxID=27357 RepID=A0AAD8X9N3_GLOAC|nr:uncharacterized protein BDZ83DRAFT_724440 [Colletotrichum acutatum]KAK1708194.1 hypothetical protein BDZ83DRAFT_724440 [Colletotrichum acutatum]